MNALRCSREFGSVQRQRVRSTKKRASTCAVHACTAVPPNSLQERAISQEAGQRLCHADESDAAPPEEMRAEQPKALPGASRFRGLRGDPHRTVQVAVLGPRPFRAFEHALRHPDRGLPLRRWGSFLRVNLGRSLRSKLQLPCMS